MNPDPENTQSPAVQPIVSWRIRQFLFLLMTAIVAYIEGFTNPFWIWNSLPIAASYCLLSRARQNGFNPLPEVGFFLVACGTVLFAHAAWFYDWGGIATESSTASLMFLTLPVYACALGSAAFGLVMLFIGRRS